MIEAPVIREFYNTFGKSPSFFIQVPGRVNLIGEHTDYNGFPVLPISIPYYITAAGSPRRDHTMNIRNTDSRYDESSFILSSSIPPARNGHWSNYVRAASQALADFSGGSLTGADVLFSGSIPGSAGLSSSSALVIASALSILAANNLNVDILELAELMAEGEHYVGTQGGGMDQAICLLGCKDHAVKIDFFPLRYAHVPFPADHSIVVAHSLIRAAKTENALLLYNRRPAECRLATALLNTILALEIPLQRLGDLPGKCADITESFVKSIFDRDSYSLEDIAKIIEEQPESITQRYLMTRNGIPMPVPPDGFLIQQRALHVFSEAERVEKTCKALMENDTETFGSLMNDSHTSCDTLYGISTPELNTLVSVMRSFGASGARLTGAGFGGCAVALVRDDSIEQVIGGIRKEYYDGYIRKTHPELRNADNFREIIFAVKPSSGASTVVL